MQGEPADGAATLYAPRPGEQSHKPQAGSFKRQRRFRPPPPALARLRGTMVHIIDRSWFKRRRVGLA